MTYRLRSGFLHRALLALLALLFGLVVPFKAYAWGFEPYQLVATLAEARVNSAVRLPAIVLECRD